MNGDTVYHTVNQCFSHSEDMYSFSCLEIFSSILSPTHQVEFEFLLTLNLSPTMDIEMKSRCCKTFSGLLVDISHNHITLL